MSLSFCGADLRVRAGRPRPASTRDEAGRGTGCRPGGPPHRPCQVLRKLTGVGLLTFVCAVAATQTPVENLRADLTYLASDELEGRGTPSKGLDLAADYIARQFQEAGLKPVAPDGSYFQVAKFGDVVHTGDEFSLTFTSGRKKLSIGKGEARVRSLSPLDLRDERAVKLPDNGTIPPVAGLVVAADEARYGREDALRQLQERKPALILLIGKERGPQSAVEELSPDLAPVIRIGNAEALEFLNQPEVTVSIHATASKEALLRNVAGILPGSDPALRGQYILLSAHYDHLGHPFQGIFHGANDNASGTVSVIEIAREIAAQPVHPKRSILFMAFFGEEEGLLGSYYYTHHPLVPLKDTIANINLEQIGRTDDTSGQKVREFVLTGSSFTTIPGIMQEAAKAEGVKVEHRKDADEFFARSDNYAFAVQGVPDSTIAVTFEYPEYHRTSDTTDKIDFDNMAKVDRAIAAGIVRLADESGIPKWTSEKAAAKYRNAASK